MPSHVPPTNGLGDLARVVRELSSDTKATSVLRIAAELLGLGIGKNVDASTERMTKPHFLGSKSDEEKPTVSDDQRKNDESGKVPSPQREELESTLLELEPEAMSAKPAVLVGEEMSIDSEREVPQTPFEPLIAARVSRSMIMQLVSMQVEVNRINVDHLIEQVVCCKPLRQIQRARKMSLRLGVQVLIDWGKGMVPYRRDQKWLVDELRRHVGRDTVRVWLFREALPTEYEPDSAEARWSPPAKGTPVLIVSDLGLYGDALESPSEEEWLVFAELLDKNGNPAIVLNPHHRDRYAATIHHRLTILPWDRNLSFRIASHRDCREVRS